MAVSEPLYGKNPAELAALCAETGLPRFAARQLARWLYVKHIEDPMLMTDIRLPGAPCWPNGSGRC